jgi:hypothetical protein
VDQNTSEAISAYASSAATVIAVLALAASIWFGLRAARAAERSAGAAVDATTLARQQMAITGLTTGLDRIPDADLEVVEIQKVWYLKLVNTSTPSGTKVMRMNFQGWREYRLTPDSDQWLKDNLESDQYNHSLEAIHQGPMMFKLVDDPYGNLGKVEGVVTLRWQMKLIGSGKPPDEYQMAKRLAVARAQVKKA